MKFRQASPLLVFIVSLGLAGCGGTPTTPANQATPTLIPPVAGNTVVVAEGRVVPVRRAELAMQTNGVIDELPIKEGDRVRKDQLLLRTNNAAQKARVAQAEAQVQQAEANLENLVEGAKPEDLTSSEATLRQAEANLRQLEESVTQEDVVAARQQLEQAELQLKRLQQGPNSDEVRAAEANLQQAQSALESQRNQLSSTKNSAELQLQQATEALKQAQTNFSTAQWQWDHVQRFGTDPLQPQIPDPNNPKKKKDNKLNNNQKQLYKDSYDRAEAALRAAESAVNQASLALETARQAEIQSLDGAQKQVNAAQANLDRVKSSIEPDQVAAAQAALTSAKANLTRLIGAQRASQLEAAQAAVDNARAQLAHTQATPQPSERSAMEAQIASARANVASAKAELDQTELHAPFDGTIISVAPHVGEFVAPGTVVVRIADTGRWQVETTDLTELNIVHVQMGAPVTLSFDALPGVQLPGTVTDIVAFGENRQGDIVYRVVITPDSKDDRMRWNMTASVTIRPRADGVDSEPTSRPVSTSQVIVTVPPNK